MGKKESMKEITPIPLVTFAGVAVLSLLMTSCASRIPQTVDHSVYTQQPDTASSKFWRGLAKSMPFSKDAAFYGNWGGSGNKGGRPIDQLDEAFRRHDIVYHESRCGAHLKAADSALVTWLERIDADTLEPGARKYRKTAIKFMSSPLANFVGKPIGVMIRKKEWDGCYFVSTEKVEQFFDPNHTGFPYPEPSITTDTTEPQSILIADSSR